MSQPLNINEILNLVRESNRDLEKSLYIPSLGKSVVVKPMTALHLKNIIKTSVSGIFANNIFNQTVYGILNEILIDESVISQINTLDKVAIILQLRQNNIRPTIEVELFSDDNKIKEEIDISTILSKIQKTSFKFDDEIILIDSTEILINFPTINQEFLFNRSFEKNYTKKIDESDKTALKEIFGVLFIYEIAQYLKSIKFKDTVIDFSEYSVDNRISVVENISGNTISKIIETVDQKFGKQLTDILTVEKTIDGITYSGKIEINPSILS